MNSFFAPAINIYSDFIITQSTGVEQYLKLEGKIKVDQFPSTEAYIKDPGGNVVFIGVNPCEGGPRDIDNSNKQEIELNLKIKTDSSGYFREVEDQWGSSYSIYSWNSRFEDKRPSRD